MKRTILTAFISLLVVLPFVVQGQQFYRVKADLSIKEKKADSTSLPQYVPDNQYTRIELP